MTNGQTASTEGIDSMTDIITANRISHVEEFDTTVTATERQADSVDGILETVQQLTEECCLSTISTVCW